MTPRTAAHQASLSFTISRSLLKLMSIEPVMPSNHLIYCHPLLLLPSMFPSTGLCSVRCLSKPVPNFSIYSGHFISHFCICWYYKNLIYSFLLFMESFDGQKLVILVNWMYQSFPLWLALLRLFFFLMCFLNCYCKDAFLICLPHVGLGFCWIFEYSELALGWQTAFR